jgi:hypothetical protein
MQDHAQQFGDRKKANVTTTAVAETETRRGGAPTRSYKVLESIELENQDHAFVEVFEEGDLSEGTVDARNTTNAYRKAFKLMREARGEGFDRAVLIVIPISQWNPTPVQARRKESITVSVGG